MQRPDLIGVYFPELVFFYYCFIIIELLIMSILKTIRLRYVIGGATCTAIGGQQSGNLKPFLIL